MWGNIPFSISSVQGPVSRKSRELFGPEKLVVKLQSACFEKLIFLHVFKIRKTKRIEKFDDLESRRCEDIKAIVAPEIGLKSFGTFEKQGPALLRSSNMLGARTKTRFSQRNSAFATDI